MGWGWLFLQSFKHLEAFCLFFQVIFFPITHRHQLCALEESAEVEGRQEARTGLRRERARDGGPRARGQDVACTGAATKAPGVVARVTPTQNSAWHTRVISNY